MKTYESKIHGQRADLTHKHNIHNGRHGWLRLTPAYSIKLVDQILDDHPDCTRVFDPFSGTATTALAAASRGHEAVACDINPFLIWLGRAKTARYRQRTTSALLDFSRSLGHQCLRTVAPPPISNIERWWGPDELLFLRELRGKILAVADAKSSVRNLLDVSFCRTLIDLSNAAFNHQSMSFRSPTAQNNQLMMFPEEQSFEFVFQNDVELVAKTAEVNPRGTAHIIQADSRNLDEAAIGKCDLLITSPPYPNRMSYIRELRPYMYWLGFLREAREAGELDWEAIGGTWGVATSLLNTWKAPSDSYVPRYLSTAVNEVAGAENKHAFVLSQYIMKYFTDIWSHLKSVRRVMSSHSSVHYIVGNSTFYGVLIPVEEVYRDMFKRLGFRDVRIKLIRKRNSKKELFEYVVSAKV